tara:strand:- start:6878 stop:7252 length:375 start_codon:yes stop_codon:yes gene_type:complete
MVKGSFNIVPITDSILGISEERDLEHILRFAEFAGNILDSNGKPVIKGEKLVKAITEKFALDFDALTASTQQDESPEQILDGLDAEDNGTSLAPNDPNSPEFVPPEQRSGATSAVPTSGGRASL